MEFPRLQVSPRLRALMAYDKFAGRVPRLLVFESQYWLDAACINAARGLGWDVAVTPVLMEGTMPRDLLERLFYTLGEFRPDFVLSINLSGMDVDGFLARLFEDIQVPLAAWFVDDPRTILMDRTAYSSPYAAAFTWEKSYCGYLRALGFAVAHHLPLAADPTVFDGAPGAEAYLPPAFVGSSMVPQTALQRPHIAAHPSLVAGVDRAFDSGRVTRAAFGVGLAALLDADVLETLDAEARRHAEIVFFTEGTKRLRHALVRLLEPEGLEVYGDDGWREVTPHAKGPLDYVGALPDFYRRCAVNVNCTSIQMASAVNQRVFDCPAAGGFLLTDAQGDLAELFDLDHEVAQYQGEDECLRLFCHYLSHPQARNEIAARAQTRILGEHTYAHRLMRIVALMKERFG